jgi:hypothetical protein
MFESLHRANITVYALDPLGLVSEEFAPHDNVKARLESLHMLAEETGGRATANSNAPWEAIAQVFRENSSYYMVGFRPLSSVADGRFRRLEVKVNRPGVQVRTRGGYFRPMAARGSAPPSAAPSGPTSDQTLASPMPGGSLRMRATAASVFVAGRRDPTIVVSVGLLPRPSGRPATQTVTTIATAFAEDWRPQGTATGRVVISVPATAARELQYDVVSTLTARPGRHQLRVGAATEGETGSVFLDLDVPDFSRVPLALSGLMLSVEPAITTAAAPDLAAVIPVTPTTVREFERWQRVNAFMRVVQGGRRAPGVVRMSATIVGPGDRPMNEVVTDLAGSRFVDRSADHSVALPIAALPAGEYLLMVEATLDRAIVRRNTRFAIR